MFTADFDYASWQQRVQFSTSRQLFSLKSMLDSPAFAFAQRIGASNTSNILALVDAELARRAQASASDTLGSIIPPYECNLRRAL